MSATYLDFKIGNFAFDKQKIFLSNCSKQLVTPVNLTRKKFHELFNFQDWERTPKAKKLPFIEVISAIVYWFSSRMISELNSHFWITAQARRKQEDNLAVVFLGIVLVFLICHTPRNICNLAETFYIDNSIQCQKINQNGFPFWVMVLNTIRFVLFLPILSLPTVTNWCFFFQIFIFE